jgi:hypothetical protein
MISRGETNFIRRENFALPALMRGYVAIVTDSYAQLFLAREAGLFGFSFCE